MLFRSKGEPDVTDIVAYGDFSEEELLKLAASAEKGSEHPLGEAIVNGAKEKGLQLQDGRNFSAIPGHGIQVEINSQMVLIGNKKLMMKNHVEIQDALVTMEQLEGEGKTAMLMAVNGMLAGIIAVADTVKESSAEAIKRMKQMGIEVIMITGDNRLTDRKSVV